MRSASGWTVTKDGHDILAGDRLKYKATAKSLVRRLLKVDPDHAYAVVRWPAQEAATTPKADAPPGATLCEVQRPVDRLRRVRWGSLTMTRGQKMDHIRRTLDTEARHLDYAARDELVRARMAWPLRDIETSIDAGFLYPDEHNPHLGSTPIGEVLKRDAKGEPTVVRDPRRRRALPGARRRPECLGHDPRERGE